MLGSPFKFTVLRARVLSAQGLGGCWEVPKVVSLGRVVSLGGGGVMSKIIQLQKVVKVGGGMSPGPGGTVLRRAAQVLLPWWLWWMQSPKLDRQLFGC